MLFVVAYDVTDRKRRYTLHKLLKEYGSPRQESLFECRLDRRELMLLRLEIRQIIKPREDGVRGYPVCAGCERKLRTGTVVHDGKTPLIV